MYVFCETYKYTTVSKNFSFHELNEELFARAPCPATMNQRNHSVMLKTTGMIQCVFFFFLSFVPYHRPCRALQCRPVPSKIFLAGNSPTPTKIHEYPKSLKKKHMHVRVLVMMQEEGHVQMCFSTFSVCTLQSIFPL